MYPALIDNLSEMQMEQIQAHNSHLQQHVANVKEQKEMLAVQLHEVQHKFEDMSKENNRLTAEIQALRQSLQVGRAHLGVLLPAIAVTVTVLDAMYALLQRYPGRLIC